jgi:hypothetical protein
MKSLLGLLLLLALPEPDSRETSRSVAGWRVRDVAESDGGRLVILSRRGPGWRFDYQLNFWRGNGGIYVGATFQRGACRSGDAEMLRPAEEALARASLDGWLRDYLGECPLPAAEEARMRRSLDAAWPVFAARAAEADAAMRAENEAIENYGREPGE